MKARRQRPLRVLPVGWQRQLATLLVRLSGSGRIADGRGCSSVVARLGRLEAMLDALVVGATPSDMARELIREHLVLSGERRDGLQVLLGAPLLRLALQRDHLGLHADRGIGRLALFANEGGPGRNGGPGVVISPKLGKRGPGFYILKCCQRSRRRCC